MTLSRPIAFGFALIITASTFATLPVAAAGSTVLRRGSTGFDVKRLQVALHMNKRGNLFQTPYFTQTFGSRTDQALRRWEGSGGDGRITVGGSEWTKLMTERKAPDLHQRAIAYSKSEGLAIDVSKRDQMVRILKGGKIAVETPARFGGAGTPTREVVQRALRAEGQGYVSSIYHTPMPYAAFFSGGQATHYSSDFHDRGYAGASHGCVNIGDLAVAQQIYNLTTPTMVRDKDRTNHPYRYWGTNHSTIIAVH